MKDKVKLSEMKIGMGFLDYPSYTKYCRVKVPEYLTSLVDKANDNGNFILCINLKTKGLEFLSKEEIVIPL